MENLANELKGKKAIRYVGYRDIRSDVVISDETMNKEVYKFLFVEYNKFELFKKKIFSRS